MTHFSERLCFNLPNAFAGDLELFSNLLQRSRVTVPETETEFEDFAFPFGQAGEDITQLIKSLSPKIC